MSEITAVSIARSLAPALALSGRTPDEGLIAAWAFVLVEGLRDRGINPILQEEFDEAVRSHLLSSTYPIQPAHVWTHIVARRETTAMHSLTADGRMRWGLEVAEQIRDITKAGQ